MRVRFRQDFGSGRLRLRAWSRPVSTGRIQRTSPSQRPAPSFLRLPRQRRRHRHELRRRLVPSLRGLPGQRLGNVGTRRHRPVGRCARLLEMCTAHGTSPKLRGPSRPTQLLLLMIRPDVRTVQCNRRNRPVRARTVDDGRGTFDPLGSRRNDNFVKARGRKRPLAASRFPAHPEPNVAPKRRSAHAPGVPRYVVVVELPVVK